jgi:predicted NAD/FAD-binding protein
MSRFPLPKSVAIIGAGPSGLFAARRFRQLGVQEITIFEKEACVGGKCSTYVDGQDDSLRAERGAFVIAPNYGEVIDALLEKGIGTERTLGARSDEVEILSKTDPLNVFQRMSLACKVAGEVYRFNRAVKAYRKCCNKKLPLPGDLEASFASFAEKYRLETINLLLKPFVSGFGYGDMRDCPTYSVLEYMGTMTIPFLIAQHMGVESCELRSIQGGFQRLMKAISEDFHVVLSADVTKVTRSERGVDIAYRNGEKSLTFHAEALVLAVSPLQWESLLGKEGLTPLERSCMEQVTYYRYPVVICRLKGLPPSYVYRPEMLNRDHFGHVAFVATLDKREEAGKGRLCSAYINQLPHHVGEKGIVWEEIEKELKGLPGVTEVEILECKVWEDYFPSIPWKLRLQLEGAQYAAATKTIYVGSYTLGSFEDVACVASQATRVIDSCFASPTGGLWKDLQRFFALTT